MATLQARSFTDSLDALGGELGRLVARRDWEGTALGPIDRWPQSLKSALGVVLLSPVPMVMLWGEDGVMLYNDAYSKFAGGRHPELLGARVREGWPEVADFNDHVMKVGLAGGTLHYADQELTLYRHGRAEQVFMNLDYSPVLDERGEPAGVLCVLAETTERVAAERARAEAEAALRAERDRAQGVLDHMDEAFVLLDHQYRFLDINAEAMRLEKRPREALLGRTHWENHPNAAPELGELFITAMTERRPVSLEHRYVWEDGRDSWIDMRANPVPQGLAVFYRDITDRKHAEERLRESEARFRLMADAVPQIVWITDADGRTEFFNRQWSDYTGVPYEPTTAANVAAEHVHPDDAAMTMAAFDEARRTGTAFHVEHRIRAETGDYRWFLVRADPYRDPGSGEVVRWFGASVDIHDRKLAEERLRQLNDTLETQVALRSAERDRLWNLSEDMLARADYSGMMSAVSPAWIQVLGWSEAELLSRGYATFMHPDDMPPTLEALARMGETGRPTRFENRIATADGGYKPIEWTVAPEPDGANFIAVGRDLSVNKAREAELEAAQEALRQSQKMEAMGQLTGGVAHDFNNLLTPIVGALDMLKRKGLGGEREQRLIAGAMQSAERAKTLVQRLLAFARRQPLQPAAVDVSTLVAGMADLVESTTGPQIKVRVEAADDLPPAKADPNQLEMALLNLAVNARDAMPDGGTLRISASAESVGPGHRSNLRPGDYVRLSVADTGVGMDEETLARAIEPFFSTKGVGKGTGLGLSMVHGLASQLGGALTMQSRRGVGTNVELWLPVSERAAVPAADPVASDSSTAARGTALLVDDEEVVRMSTADMLADLGYRVVEADSAEAALSLVAGGLAPDVLVTDHLMPGMTGTDLAFALRARRPDMPVLVVSGYAEVDGLPPDLPRLTKPFRSDELAASLAQLGTATMA